MTQKNKMKIGDVVEVQRCLSKDQYHSGDFAKFLKLAPSSHQHAPNFISFAAMIVDIEKDGHRENVTFFWEGSAYTWNWDPDHEVHYSEKHGTIFDHEYLERRIRSDEIDAALKKYLQKHPIPTLDDHGRNVRTFQIALKEWTDNHQSIVDNIYKDRLGPELGESNVEEKEN